MSRLNSINAWIETGYKQFAAEGLEGIQVERLSRITGLNKSGYYHYFGDRDSFLHQLMKYHFSIGEQLAHDMRQIKKFDPDFIHVLLKYPVPIIAHMQLVRNRQNKFLDEVYNQVNVIVDKAVLPGWAEFIGTPHNHNFALKYFEQVRDMFYSRITEKNMNYEFLHNLIYEAKGMLQEVIKMNSSQRIV
ncbi:MAG: TetR/AcrR family transcriptional regulator [Cyclobacteriaceae bacterium]|nr:TetR/AcrR family transcriptional regulator [Cyclobacteriaceae bacterium]